ncbi:alpha/beta fold hydrolase [Streptomyces sp. SID13726]|uniref:thioesterase II family protein n=1 Tax=Streptomyces sp. SID13726 TaxID=2706058 RepID=UPI0013BC7B6B|nr:alpha/beta fold hydrolase [Streptomyces sp. SID13726]NEA98886.1 thioesterase [Streptomyces sp. SID13726]
MTVPLLCFPFAGAGASFFTPWQRYDLKATRIHPVQLPGRERRLDDPPFPDVRTAVESLAGELRTQSDLSAGPVALFGHSFGAVLAYEMARHLSAEGIAVAHLFVSGSAGPTTRREVGATGLPDDEFLARVKEFAGYDHPTMADPELLELLLPTLRCDVEMHEAYVSAATDPLDAPLTSLRGLEDGLVSAEQAQQWEQVAGSGFRFEELPGGHMYLTEYPGPLLKLVDDELKAWA